MDVCSTRSMRRAARLLMLVPGLLMLAAAAWGEPLPTGPTHRGVVTVGSYQVFPENRPGNAVYLDSVLQLSVPGQIVLDVGSLPPKGRFVYLARQGDARTVGVRSGSGDPPPRVTEVSPGYYYVVTILDGVAYKKLYRVQGNTLADLLPSSKTADGVTVGEKGILFFHIGKADQPESGEATYTIGIHLALFGETRVRHLGAPVENSTPTIALKWLDASRFTYKLAGGKTETASVSDFK